MTLETELFSQLGEKLIVLAGGSPLLLGLIAFIGLAISLHKLQIGFSTGLVISTFTLGMLSMVFDTDTIGTTKLPFSLFNLGFLLIVFGVAWMVAHTIMKNR